MTILLRSLVGCALVVAALFLTLPGARNLLIIALGVGFLVLWATRRPLARAMVAAMPVVVAALGYYLLQLIGGTTSWALPLKMVTVFFWLSAGVSVLPWRAALSRCQPRSPAFHAVLYVHLISHFLRILGDETLRALRGWKWSSRGTRGRARLQALRGSVSALFLRSFERAERFYAAQLVRGLAE